VAVPRAFFFQAEDGIRYATVTGVQTCALPISLPRPTLYTRPPVTRRSLSIANTRNICSGLGRSAQKQCLPRKISNCIKRSATYRSEERRVGKECGYGRWQGRRREAKNKG